MFYFITEPVGKNMIVSLKDAKLCIHTGAICRKTFIVITIIIVVVVVIVVYYATEAATHRNTNIQNKTKRKTSEQYRKQNSDINSLSEYIS